MEILRTISIYTENVGVRFLVIGGQALNVLGLSRQTGDIDLIAKRDNMKQWEDLFKKLQKAKSIKGPKYIEIMAPCPPGWRFGMELTVEMGTMAVETGAWALYEYENDKVTFNGKSKLILEKKIKRKPIEDWIKYQGRFSHLFKPKKDVKRIKEIEEHTDQVWERYRKCYL